MDWQPIYEKLNLQFPKIVFFYTIPKVGSTTMVSSLRLYYTRQLHVFHFHDFQPFHTSIYPFNKEAFWEFIQFLIEKKNHQVYFIDIFREPIEHKISFFFDQFAHHFPASSIYPPTTSQIRKRFLQCFPYLAKTDYFFDYYPITLSQEEYPIPALNIVHQGVNYLKLRLRDSAQWGKIVETFLGLPGKGLTFFKDNITSDETYTKFVSEFKIPKELLQSLDSTTRITFYLNASELLAYKTKWETKSIDENITVFTPEEYQFYSKISGENYPIIQVDRRHYFDEGCTCSACMIQRRKIIQSPHININNTPKIFHQEAKLNLLQSRLSVLAKVANIKKHKTESVKRFKQFPKL
jgi:hypothetical protein